MIPGPFLLVFLIKQIIFLGGELALAYLPATSQRRLFRGHCNNRKSVLFWFFSLWALPQKAHLSRRGERGDANVTSGASLPSPPHSCCSTLKAPLSVTDGVESWRVIGSSVTQPRLSGSDTSNNERNARSASRSTIPKKGPICAAQWSVTHRCCSVLTLGQVS